MTGTGAKAGHMLPVAASQLGNLDAAAASTVQSSRRRVGRRLVRRLLNVRPRPQWEAQQVTVSASASDAHCHTGTGTGTGSQHCSRAASVHTSVRPARRPVAEAGSFRLPAFGLG